MKRSELRQLIREEHRRVIREAKGGFNVVYNTGGRGAGVAEAPTLEKAFELAKRHLNKGFKSVTIEYAE